MTNAFFMIKFAYTLSMENTPLPAGRQGCVLTS